MNKKRIVIPLLLCIASVGLANPMAVIAEEASSYSGIGKVQFDGEYPLKVVDPEHPDKEANPGPSPVTKGQLRFDFVPQLNFWSNAISNHDQTYYANAQLFLDDTGARGNFVQISDYREQSGGWSLQVRQETQLTNPEDKTKELKGAIISFDKSWTNSINDPSSSPQVSKEVIRINNIGETYDLAKAKMGTGEGSWSIVFGASIDNENGQKDTLSPRLDPLGNPILDSNFNDQPIYQNNAVSLTVPGKTKKEPVQYQTVLTWILSELP